jgi:periplasmic copper chaperone A
MTMNRPLRRLTRTAAVIATTGLVALAGAGVASAHVTAQPGTAAKGSIGEITFRVPDEDPSAGTIKLEVTLPLDHPIASVSTTPIPGWTAQTTMAKLDKPVKTADGTEITQAVQTITWTAQPGTRIQPGQAQNFTIMAKTIPNDTDKLLMPATQTYDNGEVERWDQPPAAPGTPKPEHPAPLVTLTANTTAAQGMSGMPGQVNTAASQDMSGPDTTARWLGGIALGLAVIALGIALSSARRGRRQSS